MEKYKHFQMGTIVWAYYLAEAEEEQIQKDIEFVQSHIPLKKAYLESHRGLVDVPVEKMRKAKEIFEKNGIDTAGCITSTGLVGERKPSIFDTYCFTDEAHRQAYLKIVEDLAGIVDEIILDDYFFCSCRCEKCLEAKKSRSWSEYRLDLMEDFSRVITGRAKEINPNMNFIIKYPNWYESFQETGYNPEKQKDIFDMIYAGTETRDAVYSHQHLQRYHSYSMIRYMENIAPGRNGGGWIDPFGSEEHEERLLEQAEFSLYGKAKELMLFNFEELVHNKTYRILGNNLYRTDGIVGQLGNPVGTCVYEPYNGDGEDLLYTYLGMRGAAMEPTPEFREDAPVIFLAQSAGADRDVMTKMEKYVRNGGIAVVTTGFFKEQYDKGMKDMTSLRLTGRHVSGKEFMINFRNHTDTSIVSGDKEVLFEVLQYKTNASWADVAVIAGEYNFPLLSEDNYGKGRLFILNVPDNFADIYHLPAQVMAAVNKVLSEKQMLYIACEEKSSLFTYDNDTFALYSFAEQERKVSMQLRKGEGSEEYKHLVDLETGEVYDECMDLPKPCRWFDGCTVMPEAEEYAIKVTMQPKSFRFFRIVR